MREVVFDTETTSTDAKVDRAIEVGCVDWCTASGSGTSPAPFSIFI
ncbi:hypothetical protein [Methylobacterium fujisawaense]